MRDVILTFVDVEEVDNQQIPFTTLFRVEFEGTTEDFMDQFEYAARDGLMVGHTGHEHRIVHVEKLGGQEYGD